MKVFAAAATVARNIIFCCFYARGTDFTLYKARYIIYIRKTKENHPRGSARSGSLCFLKVITVSRRRSAGGGVGSRFVTFRSAERSDARLAGRAAEEHTRPRG